MSDVFLSYKAEDRRRVQMLVQALQAGGYSVWWDEHIGAGDEWRRTIEQQLDSSKCVIVVWSKGSVGPNGDFVRDEASRARARGVYIPVLIDAVQPPLGFGESQAASLRGWKGDRTDPQYESVLASVRRLAGPPAAAPAVKRTAEVRTTRRTVLVGGLVAVVAVAGLGAWQLFDSGSTSRSDSIAVLPFANLSGDPAQSYFSDGIAEELRNALARLAGLKVVARTSSEAVRNDDAQTAAKKLGVANILTGSVRQSPSTLRISAQLIDGRSGIERWSQSYDRAPGDAIKIQADIAEKVARAMSIALAGPQRTALAVGGTRNADAHKLILESEQLSRHIDEKSLGKALERADAAILLDPNYARAFAVKARLLNGYAGRYASNSAELQRSREEATQLAMRAVELAPDLPHGHLALSEIYRSELRAKDALEEIRKAESLAPGDSTILVSYGSFLSHLGSAREALDLIQRAIVRDPLNPVVYGSRTAALFRARRCDEAVDKAAELRDHSPELYNFSAIVGDCLVLLGRNEDALKEYRKGDPNDPYSLFGEALIAARTGRGTVAEDKIQKMRTLYGDLPSYQFGELYAQLGRPDEAFRELEHACEIKDGGLLALRADPWLDPIRSDPRFARLLRKLSFPD